MKAAIYEAIADAWDTAYFHWLCIANPMAVALGDMDADIAEVADMNSVVAKKVAAEMREKAAEAAKIEADLDAEATIASNDIFG